MNTAPTATPSLADTNLELLQTGRYSDLALLCEGTRFLVHKSIICPRSPVFAAAVDGQFAEAKTNTIVVEIVDPKDLFLALHYLYTIKYDWSPDSGTWPVYLQNNTLTTTADAHAFGVNGDLQDPQSDANAPSSKDAAEADFSEHDSEPACVCKANRTKSPCKNEELRAHVSLYIFGDYYQVPPLKYLAKSLFISELKYSPLCPHKLGEICQMVYSSTSDKDGGLRSTLSEKVSRRGMGHMFEDKTFMQTALLLPKLLRDIIGMLLKQISDAKVLEKVAVEAAKKACAAKMQRDKDSSRRLIDLVNRVKKCERCGTNNHASFLVPSGERY